MTRKNKMDHASGGLRAAMEKAWKAFEDPENQKRIKDIADEDKQRATENGSRLRIKKLRQWGAPKIAAELVANESVSTTAATQAVNTKSLLQILAGNPGCGKTVAAVTILESRETGCFVRAAELVELGNHFSDRDMLSRYRSTGVLVIDDLGVEYRSEQMICRLDELLDSRAAANLPTVITTNLTAEEFRGRYEERIWSRINQFGDYHELDEPDLRVTPIGSRKK
jgi:hypothetical protein